MGPETSAYTSDIEVSYNPGSTCSGRESKGASNVAFGTRIAHEANTAKVFAFDIDLVIPTPVVTTTKSTYHLKLNGEDRTFSETQSSDPDYPIFNLYMFEITSPEPQDPQGSNVASCTSSIGTMTVERAFITENGTQVYAAGLVILPAEISGQTELSINVRCNKPILEVNAGGNGIAQYYVDEDFPTTVHYDPVLISKVKIDMAKQRLCKVQDIGRIVNFKSQVDPLWANDPYGIVNLSSDPQHATMAKFGCSLAAISMLFDSYGIKNIPRGSPQHPTSQIPYTPITGLNGEALNPGTLNTAMALYQTAGIKSGSVGFNGNNDPEWAGAAEVGRAGYTYQCQNPANLCSPANAPNVVSFKSIKNSFTEVDEKYVEDQICAGNPVILKFRNSRGGQHYMLATGYGLTRDGSKSLILQNPGTRAGLDNIYSNLKEQYPEILGYVAFSPSNDPTMIFISSPSSVHFVVTDPMGRRTGFDPSIQAAYNEIPGASYGRQSIDSPDEDGVAHETLVSENYFVSSQDVPEGGYSVQVHAVNTGPYYIDYRGHDAQGYSNNSIYKTGTLLSGKSATIELEHSARPALIKNADLLISRYQVKEYGNKRAPKSEIAIEGKVLPHVAPQVGPPATFKIGIGGVTGYSLSIPLAEFKRETKKGITTNSYKKGNVDIEYTDTGEFKIALKNVNLNGMDEDQIDHLSLEAGNLKADILMELDCANKICSLEGVHADPRHNKCHHKRRGK